MNTFINILLSMFLALMSVQALGGVDDYIGYYNFDGNVLDQSINELHGMEHGNSIDYETGVKGLAIEFNNSNHGVLEVNDYVSFPAISTEAFTVAMWVYYRSSSYGGGSMFFSMGNAKVDTVFEIYHADGNGLRAEILSDFGTSSLTYYNTPQTAFTVGEWVHVAATYDDGAVKLYVNGDFREERALDFDPIFFEKPFFISYHEWDTGNFNATRFNGLIDEMYIWDRALSAEEVSMVFNDEIFTCQQISLSTGWNLISAYALPSDPEMLVALSSVSSEIVLAKDEAGNVAIPSIPFNQIGDWAITEGYYVKSYSDTSFEVGCHPVDPETTPIPLSSGWNIASYLRNGPLDPSIAFAGLGDTLIIAKDYAGKVYVPSLGFNGIGDLQPGQGYQIKVAEFSILYYPENE